MVQNIESVLARGEKLDVLVDKTDDLQDQAQKFQRQGTMLRKKMWWVALPAPCRAAHHGGLPALGPGRPGSGVGAAGRRRAAAARHLGAGAAGRCRQPRVQLSPGGWGMRCGARRARG